MQLCYFTGQSFGTCCPSFPRERQLGVSQHDQQSPSNWMYQDYHGWKPKIGKVGPGD